MTVQLVAGGAVLAVLAFIGYAIYRASRDPFMVEEPWRGPAIGSRWEIAGRVYFVIDDGWFDDIHKCVLIICEYVTESGVTKRQTFTPYQWDAEMATARRIDHQ
jgi:hypothetical protein